MAFLDDVKERGAFKIANREDRPLKIILNPWGQEIDLAPNLSVEVFFLGDSAMSDNLEVSPQPDALIVTVKDASLAFFRMRALDQATRERRHLNGAETRYSTAAE